jgi:DNA-binding response OmpR family regulator
MAQGQERPRPARDPHEDPGCGGQAEDRDGETIFELRDLRVDLASRRIWLAGKEVRLTRTEFNLMAALVKHAGKVLTHRQLLREVWGPGATEPHYVRVYMGHLRHKLEADPAQPRTDTADASLRIGVRPAEGFGATLWCLM